MIVASKTRQLQTSHATRQW